MVQPWCTLILPTGLNFKKNNTHDALLIALLRNSKEEKLNNSRLYYLTNTIHSHSYFKLFGVQPQMSNNKKA